MVFCWEFPHWDHRNGMFSIWTGDGITIQYHPWPKAATMPAVSYARLQGHATWQLFPRQLSDPRNRGFYELALRHILKYIIHIYIHIYIYIHMLCQSESAWNQPFSPRGVTWPGAADKAFQPVGGDAWQRCLESRPFAQWRWCFSQPIPTHSCVYIYIHTYIHMVDIYIIIYIMITLVTTILKLKTMIIVIILIYIWWIVGSDMMLSIHLEND